MTRIDLARAAEGDTREKEFPRARWVFVLLGFCLCGGGCGKSQGEISGKVTYRGKVLTFGTVSILDDEGRVHHSPIGTEGAYHITDVAPGPATLVVTCIDPKEAEKLRKKLGRGSGGPRRKMNAPVPSAEDAGESKGPLIPLFYGDIQKSDLKFTVAIGTNTFDLKLQDPPEMD